MIKQQGDVLLYQTDDDGEINVADGIVEMSGGLETAAYLSLFGGNEEDNGLENNPLTWWGNLEEIDPVRQYRSDTQYLLQALPATTVNLLRIQDAAFRDLSWLVKNNIASDLIVEATMPGLNKIKLVITIQALGKEVNFEYVENWKANA
jgi:phage gp46-like protein